ncbi:MAG TPA: winged helix-turn-helix domain-containing protein [Pyrinomonadaceae bacterium]|jgi:DNA-binding winged helix-turn-helix (wHTH) protein/tetratricopeptide (TPR) repeat protein
MNDRPPAFYEFGPFRIDLRRHLLLRGDEHIPLSPKALQTLLVLVEHRGRVVRKEELLGIIWPDSFVEESNLAQNVFVLRKVLGEEKSEHRYIVTVPGAGYRFVAPVREVGAAAGAPTLPPDADARADAAADGVTSIAVLPFKSLAAAAADDFLGLGLADALITRLSSLKRLAVRPTSAVMQYHGRKHDPAAVGRELNVESLLDGVFQRDGAQIRVSVQFIRVGDGATLWAAQFDESFTNIFSIQDSISEQVARALALKLSGEEQRRLRQNYTDNTDAFQLYIRGRYFWNQRTAAGLRKGIEYAQQAIALDPTYAPAYVGLADCYNLLPGYGGCAPKESFPKAKAAALRALEIDAALAEGYASLGFVNYRYEWDWAEAERNFRRAVELKPGYATAHHWYGEALAAAARFAESLAALDRAQELDPLSLPISTDYAQTLFFARRYGECEAWLRRTLEMDQRFVRAHVIRGAALEQLGEYAEAAAALARAAELSDGSPLALSGLAHVYALAGKKRAARAILRQLEQLSAETYVSPYNRAVIHAGLGEQAQALAALEQAVGARDVWLVWLGVNPRFDALRAAPRFAALLRRVGLAR